MTNEPSTSAPSAHDPLGTDLLTVSQVCRRLPGARSNDQVSPSTGTRWILSGCPSRGGARVKLAAIRVGGRWMISPAALQEFFAALASPTSVATSSTAGTRTEAQRRTASERAARELERRGA
jgi:hypothetical protein